MCAACGVPTHVAAEPGGTPGSGTAGGGGQPAGREPAKFAALRNPTCRVYLGGAALAMMGDNIEHVITYWVVWEKFHSAALTGFEVISHWLPFLLLSLYFGGARRPLRLPQLIQASQVLFMVVSITWGILFATGTLTVWNACILLVLHGMAGRLWGPRRAAHAHDFVGPAELPSAIRLNSTVRPSASCAARRRLGAAARPRAGARHLRSTSSSTCR